MWFLIGFFLSQQVHANCAKIWNAQVSSLTHAADIIPNPPTELDYSRRIASGDPYEILSELPTISESDIALLRIQYRQESGFVVREKNRWSDLFTNASLPKTVEARLESLSVKYENATGYQLGDFQAQIQIGTIPNLGSRRFHSDAGPNLTAIDVWHGDMTYIARTGSLGAFQVGSTEAVVLDHRIALHAYPDSKDGIPEPDRILVRMVPARTR